MLPGHKLGICSMASLHFHRKYLKIDMVQICLVSFFAQHHKIRKVPRKDSFKQNSGRAKTVAGL